MTGAPEYVEENGAGMGKVRLNLVKLGCYVNVDAPTAVGQQLVRDPGVLKITGLGGGRSNHLCVEAKAIGYWRS